MFAVVALLLFGISWFEHGAGSGSVPVWFNWQGVALLGLAALAADLFWPMWRARRVPPT